MDVLSLILMVLWSQKSKRSIYYNWWYLYLKTEQGKVDQANYIYPVIKTNHYRVWKLSQSYYYPDDMWDDWGFSVDDRIIGMVSLKFAIISIN